MVLDQLGRYDEARSDLAALDALEPPNVSRLMALASVERNSGNFRAAAELLDRILAIDPAHERARNARARIAIDLGEPDAFARIRQALAAEPDNRDLLIGLVAAAENTELRRDAIQRLSRAAAADPGWHEGQSALAAAMWEDGARDSFAAHYEDAVAALPADGKLWQSYVAAFAMADDFAAAADQCLRAERATSDPAFAAAGFSFLSASGRMREAETLLARLPAGALQPIALAKHRLRQRDPQAAEALLAIETERAPDDIAAWALRGIAWQLLGDPRFDWLNRQDGLVGIQTLPLAADEISAIADRLRALHATSTIRVNQSVRGGTQTLGNLFDRVEPEIATLSQAITDAVDRYRNLLPPFDPTHPILKHRDTPFAFRGSWSVRLTEGGFHVQHMHPQGIVSAASYWAVPDAGADTQAGQLEIGGTPAYLALDLPPMLRVEPKVGRLVLFPSTLHHGTSPFPAGERISVAFDVAAGRRQSR
jgi:Tfp pilus assembly protein PilF